MKNCSILTLALMFTVTGSPAIANDSNNALFRAVDQLERNGRISGARNRLEAAYRRNSDPKILRKWLSLDEAQLASLESRNYKRYLTEYTPVEPTLDEWDRQQLREYVKERTGISWKPISSLAIWTFGFRAKSIKSTGETPISTISLDSANSTLRRYEEVKQSQQRLSTLISAIESDLSADVAIPINLAERQDKVKTRLIDSRANYLTYEIVSPYLARTSQLINHSRNGGGNQDLVDIGHDVGTLREAARTFGRIGLMSKGEIFQYTRENVKDQFFSVYREFKDIAGEKEHEELIIIQSLADTISSAPSMGPQSWWL